MNFDLKRSRAPTEVERRRIKKGNSQENIRHGDQIQSRTKGKGPNLARKVSRWPEKSKGTTFCVQRG